MKIDGLEEEEEEDKGNHFQVGKCSCARNVLIDELADFLHALTVFSILVQVKRENGNKKIHMIFERQKLQKKE